ncbi:sugar phosphate isomerase/epimerase family protein [Paludibaculum fermentans]|uniref:Sugar phosphate isomerase/epimerase n=1 Tax=Paludibaculum fermentans TaxID=1473598 RepID=A0A7S7NNE2_PALFE|nr:TIM barrel protein [Paludibaculum fermentans]QOY86823.1 sugar phosphate isomerase/epimerase [Paludibaculum fermentans]
MTYTRRGLAQALSAGALCVPLMAGRRLKIGIGAYTYHAISTDAMIDQLRALKVTEIEMSRGEFMNFNKPPAELFGSFRSKIDAAGIRCVSYYAPTIKDKADLDGAIRFARILGCSNITGDPTGGVLKYVDERMSEEGMSFGIHNHYFKNRKFDYESPEDILRALDGLSETVGCTLDVGHIVSCGHDTVDAVRKLGPRLKLVHLKDIQARGGEVNVPLGQGLCRIPEVMKELHRIGFKGLIALEYEKDGDILDDVRRQIAAARKMA